VKARALIELVVAALAAVGCVASWLAAGRSATAPPILPSEPSMTVEVYSAPLIVLALLLATLAGVLIVLGVARLRRR
jgi:riboflavin transporter FmnP